MKEINLKERKQIQYDMLKEIDTFCKANDIKYSLAFGTLLGAIRHKGFIPWDDDLDIMMPLEDMLKFKSLFKSDNLKFCDVDTQRYYDLDFPRIANKMTYKLEGKGVESYGISIDTYVYIQLPTNEDLFFKKLQSLEDRRHKFIYWRSRIMNHVPVGTIPGYTNAVKSVRDYEMMKDINDRKGRYYMIAGPLNIREKLTYDRDIFQEMTTAQFEDSMFPIISEYDYFLTKRYGDYMQLPPEEDRHPYHNATYYWK